MSAFLPEGVGSSGGGITPASFADPTDSDVQLMQRVLRTAAARPQQIPSEFMAQLIDAIQVSNLLIPVSQLSGFSQFTVSAAATAAQETTTSTTYTDLATVGPTLTGIPDGSYVFLFGSLVRNSGASGSFMSLQINGTTASDSDSLQFDSTASPTVCRAVTKTLKNGGNNTITAKYRVSGGTGRFENRWLLGLRYANL